MAKNEFWVGRLIVEVAIALSAVRSGNVEFAQDGLQECLDDYLSDNPDPELVEYLDSMRREQQALTPVDISYTGGGSLTGQEIARRI